MIRKETDPIHWVIFIVGTIIIFAVALAATLLLMAGMIAVNLNPEFSTIISMGVGTLGFIFFEYWLITDIFYKD